MVDERSKKVNYVCNISYLFEVRDLFQQVWQAD